MGRIIVEQYQQKRKLLAGLSPITLETTTNYPQKVHSKQLVGMFLCVFVRTSYVSCVSDIRTAAAGCGIMGKMVW